MNQQQIQKKVSLSQNKDLDTNYDEINSSKDKRNNFNFGNLISFPFKYKKLKFFLDNF